MRLIPILAAATLLAAPAIAQTGTTGTRGGLGSLLGGGGALPSLGGVGAGNAAGMLSYCVKNQLLGGATAGTATGTSGLLGGLTGAPGATPAPAPSANAATTQSAGAQTVLGRLLGRKDVTTSPGFAAGQSGQLQLGGGRALPVAGLQDQVKSRLCSAMLSRARSFL